MQRLKRRARQEGGIFGGFSQGRGDLGRQCRQGIQEIGGDCGLVYHAATLACRGAYHHQKLPEPPHFCFLVMSDKFTLSDMT